MVALSQAKKESIMLTLFHAPQSRSTRVVGLVHAMGIADRVDIRVVSIPRVDGTGARDPANPHPDGKVPLLMDGAVAVWETAAIMIHLTDLFPEAGLGVPVGDPRRGEFLSWMVWYQGVVEPALICDAAGVDHPWIRAAIRGRAEVLARLDAALARGPWLMGDRFTAADMLLASPFQWFQDALPESARVAEWVARCSDRPWSAAVQAQEAAAMQAAA
jgi:glutathione S-transferase